MSLGSMYPAVLTIVLIGILLGIGIYTLSEVSYGVAADALTITNESVTIGTTPVTLATVANCNSRTYVATSLLNTSSGATIPTTNYTLSTAGVLTGTNGANDYNNTAARISYTYVGTTRTASTDACEILGTSGTATGGFASWIAVIVVVLAAAVVLGIVLTSFGKGGAV